jgi:hypothetical protein
MVFPRQLNFPHELKTDPRKNVGFCTKNWDPPETRAKLRQVDSSFSSKVFRIELSHVQSLTSDL